MEGAVGDKVTIEREPTGEECQFLNIIEDYNYTGDIGKLGTIVVVGGRQGVSVKLEHREVYLTLPRACLSFVSVEKELSNISKKEETNEGLFLKRLHKKVREKYGTTVFGSGV